MNENIRVINIQSCFRQMSGVWSIKRTQLYFNLHSLEYIFRYKISCTYNYYRYYTYKYHKIPDAIDGIHSLSLILFCFRGPVCICIQRSRHDDISNAVTDD